MLRHRIGLLACFCFGLSIASAEQWRISPNPVPQGNAAVITMDLSKDENFASITGTFLGNTVSFFVSPEGWTALVPVPAKTPTGSHVLRLNLRSAAGGVSPREFEVTVSPAHFPTQHVKVPKSRGKLMSKTIIRREKDLIAEAVSKPLRQAQWQGVFAVPATGRISSNYGTRRTVNGRPWGQHSGVDIGAPSGAKVMADNAGRVVFAQKLWMRGNTLIVDHGMNLFSLYNHLSKILVKPGEQVSKGQCIARVGNTGLASGPHLHWELRVGMVPTNPWWWVRQGMDLSH